MVRSARLEDAPVIAELLGDLGYPASGESVKERLEALTPMTSYFWRARAWA